MLQIFLGTKQDPSPTHASCHARATCAYIYIYLGWAGVGSWWSTGTMTRLFVHAHMHFMTKATVHYTYVWSPTTYYYLFFFFEGVHKLTTYYYIFF